MNASGFRPTRFHFMPFCLVLCRRSRFYQIKRAKRDSDSPGTWHLAPGI
jgi:hypothetical protein